MVAHVCRVGVGFFWISQTLFMQSTRSMNAALAHTLANVHTVSFLTTNRNMLISIKTIFILPSVPPSSRDLANSLQTHSYQSPQSPTNQGVDFVRYLTI